MAGIAAKQPALEEEKQGWIAPVEAHYATGLDLIRSVEVKGGTILLVMLI